MRARVLAAAVLALGLGAGQGAAQDAPDPARPGQGQLRSPVLTIEADRLFAETLFGERIRAQVGAAADALAVENRGIEAMLQEEVDSLTERRPTMEVAAFRAEAEAFDARVQAIRAAQDAKERALNLALGEGREAFLEAATPVLGQLMIDSGAVVILDRRSVFLGVGLIDVTDAAVAAIDAALGEGDWTAPDLSSIVPEAVPVEGPEAGAEGLPAPAPGLVEPDGGE